MTDRGGYDHNLASKTTNRTTRTLQLPVRSLVKVSHALIDGETLILKPDPEDLDELLGPDAQLVNWPHNFALRLRFAEQTHTNALLTKRTPSRGGPAKELSYEEARYVGWYEAVFKAPIDDE